MALILLDRVQETTVTTGTGTITLAGAVSGYQSFAGVGNGNTCYYTIVNNAAWEVGVGTYSTTGPTLARTTIISNSNGNTSPITLAGSSTVFLTYPAEKAVALDASGNVTALGTVASGTWQATTIGTAYGGTGVTTSSGASSNVLRDANSNVTANNFLAGYNVITAAAGTTVLTAASAYYQRISGSTTQTIQLPIATTMVNGQGFTFDNDSSGVVTVVDSASATIDTIPSGGYGYFFVEDNTTSAGSWGKYALLPANYDFNTTAANFGGAVLSNGTWNGSTITPAYGGTGLTSFTSGGAIYASSTSTLTSGTLPISGGGTGFSGAATAGGVAYGSGTALAFTSVGTSGQVLTSNATSAPTFSSNIDGVTIGGTTPAAGSFTTLVGGGGSANYGQLTGGATTKAVVFQTLGTDTNISQVFQTKGTGAIDLAAGSSGVNISNGGTVTAVTRTATGSSYTGFPSIAISAPTTAGGVQATATPQLVASNATVVSGGTGYTVADVLTVTTAGGSSAINLTVTTVSSGVITAVTVNSSALTTIPSGTVSVSGGTGSGATFNLSYVVAATFTITNAGSGYVEQPTVTFSGGGGSGAAAYATVGATATIKGLYGGGAQIPLQFSGPSGALLQIMESGNTSTPTALIVKGGASSTQQYPSVSNASIQFSSNGTGILQFYTNTLTVEQLRVVHTASAVNYVQVTGAATGNQPQITAQGSDANIVLNIASKGAASIIFNANGAEQFRTGSNAPTANSLQLNGAATGSSPSLQARGTDTDINLTLTPKGAGNIVAGAGSFSGTHIGTWNGNTIAVANGGTGLTTAPTNGQIDIGSTGVGFVRTTLTAGTGISVTNSAGGITIANTSPSSGGTVTSVTGTSPVSVATGTTTPVISLAAAYGDTLNPYASKTANFFLAAPNGSAGAPAFRAIVAADIPTLNQNTTGTAAGLSATLAVASGGTANTTAQGAMNTFAGAVTSGQYLRGNGTNVVMSAIQAADVPTLNQNTTGNAATATTASSLTNFTAAISTNPSSVDSPTTLDVVGYCAQAGLPFSQADGGLYSAGYSTSWYHQIFGDFRTGQIAIRGKNSGTWQAWRSVLDSTNYNSYSPTLTGTGASGTWGISITGNAANVTGTVAVANGGTGAATLTANNVLLGNGTSALQVVAPGTSGNVLTSNGTTWTSAAASGGGATITATTTNTTYYLVGSTAVSGTMSTAYVSNTNAVSYNASTGTLTAVVLTASSDETLKTNWRPLPVDYVEQLAKVKHGTFDRIETGNTEDGVGAQSLRPLLPNSVVADENGFLSVNYGGAAMVSAIQLAQRVVEQDARIAKLEALVAQLLGE